MIRTDARQILYNSNSGRTASRSPDSHAAKPSRLDIGRDAPARRRFPMCPVVTTALGSGEVTMIGAILLSTARQSHLFREQRQCQRRRHGPRQRRAVSAALRPCQPDLRSGLLLLRVGSERRDRRRQTNVVSAIVPDVLAHQTERLGSSVRLCIPALNPSRATRSARHEYCSEALGVLRCIKRIQRSANP